MPPMQETSQPFAAASEQGLRMAGEAPTDLTPENTHARRKAELEVDARRLDRLSRRISTLRLIALLSGIGFALARGFEYLPLWSWWVAGAFGAGFVALLIWHARLDQAERRVAAGIELHRWALERLAGRFHTYPA